MKVVLLLAASLIASTAPSARAQSKAAEITFPATDRGRLARQWLDAYNGGDAAAYRKYMETNAETGGTPIDTRLERFAQMRENLGNLTVLEAKETSEGVELKVKTAKGDEGTLTVMIGTSAPFKFQAVRVEI